MIYQPLSFERVSADLRAAFGEWRADNAPQFAAAIAFYTILSLGPLLVFAVAVAGTLFHQEAARGEIVTSTAQYIGRDAAEMVQEMIADASVRRGGLLTGIVGFGVLAFAASRIFLQLKVALNQILDAPPPERGGIAKAILDRAFSIVAVAAIGLFLMVSIAISAILNRIGDLTPIPGGSFLLQTASHLGSLLLITILIALVFRFLPDAQISWRRIWEGAAFTSTLFVLGQMAISIYLARAEPGSSFGAAGPLIVLIVWVYFTTVIFFFGAEFMEVRWRRDAAQPPGAIESARRDVVSRPVPVKVDSRSQPGRPGSQGGARIAGSLTLGGCAGILLGVGATMFGLLLGSVKLLAKFRGGR